MTPNPEALRAAELLPCPFCGGKADYAANPFHGDNSMAQCRTCGASAYWKKWECRIAFPPAGAAEPAPAPLLIWQDSDGRLHRSDGGQVTLVSPSTAPLPPAPDAGVIAVNGRNSKPVDDQKQPFVDTKAAPDADAARREAVETERRKLEVSA